MFNQVAEQPVRKALLIRPVRVTEDPVEHVRIRRLDRAHGVLKRQPQILWLLTYVSPASARRNLEAVVFGEGGVVDVSFGFLESVRELLVVDVADPLEEEEWENVTLEVGLIDRPAENVRSAPEVLLQL